MCKIYCGVDDIAREVSGVYIGVNGKARQVQKIYIGVDGIAHQIYPQTAEPIECDHEWMFDHIEEVCETDDYMEDSGRALYEVWICKKCGDETSEPHTCSFEAIVTGTTAEEETYYNYCPRCGAIEGSYNEHEEWETTYHTRSHSWSQGDDDMYICSTCGRELERGDEDWCVTDGGHKWVLIDEYPSGKLLYQCSECGKTTDNPL